MSIETNDNSLDTTKLMTLAEVRDLVAQQTVKLCRIAELDPDLLQAVLDKATIKESFILFPIVCLIKHIQKNGKNSSMTIDFVNQTESLCVEATNNINFFILAGVDIDLPGKLLKDKTDKVLAFKEQISESLSEVRQLIMPTKEPKKHVVEYW